MNWLIWRQHRKQFILLGVIIGLYAALAIPTGMHFWDTYQDVLAACGSTNTCGQLTQDLLRSNWALNVNPSLPAGGFNLVILLVLLVPFLLGMFVGVPLIAREYNERTNLLVWTRSVSRRKWLSIKLVWTLAGAALFAGIFTVLTTWWSQTGNALYLDRFDTIKFGLQGIAPVGYAVFAVSLGIALGTWLKRTMLAIGLTLSLLLVVQIMVSTLVRPHYMTPQTHVTSILQNKSASGDDNVAMSPQAPEGNAHWVVGGGLVDKTGQPMSWTRPPQGCVVNNPVQQAAAATSSATAVTGNTSRDGGPVVNLLCLGKLGYTWTAKYQPANRYWKFQGLEFGLYLALSLVPLGATYWLVLRRDA